VTATVRDLRGDTLIARDGAIGSVDDVYFDDERWAVRYLVVDTGDWMPGRRVLISPASLEPHGAQAGAVRVNITREQVKSAPPVATDRPVSRQYEMAHAAHFGYPYYWSGPMLWGPVGVPMAGSPPHAGLSPMRSVAGLAAQAQLEQGDSHLRSGAEVIGYDIEARDGAIGAVEDFALDDENWAIHHVVVDTHKWWPGGEVRVAPQDVESIDWSARKMRLRLTREELRARR
jgi:uncharacterized protein YrrD